MGKLLLHPPVGDPLVCDKDEVTVGRDQGNDLVVAEGSVSRRHARLVRRGATWNVIDQGSANGTFLGSQRVSEAELRNGQELRFGGMPYKVEIEGAPGGAPPPLRPAAGAELTVMQSAPLAPPPPVAAPPPAVTTAIRMPPAAAPRPESPRVAPAPPPALPAAPPPRRVAPSPSAPPRAPDAKKGRGPLFWIGLGCGGCLTVIVALVALLGGGAYWLMSGPANAVADHVTLVRAGDLAGAHSLLSEDYRARMPLPEFTELVEAHPALRDNKEVHVWPPSGSLRRVNRRAVVSALLVGAGARETLRYELVDEGGAWRIAAIGPEVAE